MIEQMVSKHKHMQARHAEASSYRQSTMTQEFKPASEERENIPLPPNWQRMWDGPGKKEYFFNLLDYDMQTDIEKVYERALMTQQDTMENDRDEFIDTVFPDGVGSNQNNTISPSPVTDRSTSRYYDKKRAPVPQKPQSNGGFVDMTEESTSGSETDYGESFLPAPKTPPPVARRKKQKMTKASPKTANPWATRGPKVLTGRALRSAYSSVDEILGSAEDYEREVRTQDLPSTQDFGTARALVDLQSEPPIADEDNLFHPEN
jgi:hypothetical protein